MRNSRPRLWGLRHRTEHRGCTSGCGSGQPHQTFRIVAIPRVDGVLDPGSVSNDKQWGQLPSEDTQKQAPEEMLGQKMA